VKGCAGRDGRPGTRARRGAFKQFVRGEAGHYRYVSAEIAVCYTGEFGTTDPWLHPLP
jgi:hypothetical protein